MRRILPVLAMLAATVARGQEPVRLLSWNVRGMGASEDRLARPRGRGTEVLEAVARRVAAEGADLVALQEVRRPGVASLFVDQAAALGMRLGMGWVGPEGEDGLTLFSRYPILASEVRSLPAGSTLLLARIALPGAPAGTWLGTVRLAAKGEPARRAQAEALGRVLASLDGPVLVAVSTRGEEPAQWRGYGFESVSRPTVEVATAAGLPRASRILVSLAAGAAPAVPYLEWFPDDFDAGSLSARLP